MDGQPPDSDELTRQAARLGVALDPTAAAELHASLTGVQPRVAARTPPRLAQRRGGPSLRRRVVAMVTGGFDGSGPSRTVADLLAAFCAGETDPVAELHATRDRIDAANPVLNSVIAVLGSSADKAAQESAMRWRAGKPRPLDGVPIGIKDVIDVAGVPTTAPELDDLTVTVDGEKLRLYQAQSRSTMLCNLAGVPRLTLPTGFAPDECPVAAQIVTAPHAEDLALRIAAVYQQVSDHHRQLPAFSS